MGNIFSEDNDKSEKLNSNPQFLQHNAVASKKRKTNKDKFKDEYENENEYENKNENENENENEVYFEQPKQKTRKKRVTFRNNKSKGNRKF